MNAPPSRTDTPPGAPAGRPHRSHTRRNLLVGLGAGVVAGGTALLVGRDGEEPTPGPQPATTVTGTPFATLPAVPADQRLTWSPPVLQDPVHVQVTADEHVLDLDSSRDYVLVMPSVPLQTARGLDVTGGRNVVLIGGEIRAPDESEEELDRRALYLKDQTGTIHVEGLRMTGNLAEGINLSQPEGATVQLQNISIDVVRGTRDGNHADLLQTWLGPDRLLVDGLSGSSNYQAMFLQPNEYDEDGPTPTAFDLRRLRLRGVDRHGYMLWAPEEADWLQLSDVQVVLEWDRGRSMALEPEDVWADVEIVEEFTGTMPAGTPGIGYVSPGYARS